jgi:hypothetical protein
MIRRLSGMPVTSLLSRAREPIAIGAPASIA